MLQNYPTRPTTVAAGLGEQGDLAPKVNEWRDDDEDDERIIRVLRTMRIMLNPQGLPEAKTPPEGLYNSKHKNKYLPSGIGGV